MSGPLDGIRVVDFTRVLAGPHCTRTLSDLGASVIKVEPPGVGDVARYASPRYGEVSGYFAQQNVGKRNVAIDLNLPEGREVARRLIRSADVVVENFRPGTLASFDLDYERIARDHPDVIYVSISGYGQTGPWRSRAAYAQTVQAEVGHAQHVWEHFEGALSEPRSDAFSHGDVYTGLEASIATIAALYERKQSGRGQHVDVSIAATLLAVNERAHVDLSGGEAGDEPLALGASWAHFFRLSDGRRVVIASTPVFSPIFALYCAMMRRNDLRGDPRFATAALRRENLAALLAEVQAWVLTFRSFAELESQVEEVGLAVGLVRSMNELGRSEWARETEAVLELADGRDGTLRIPGAPWRFSRSALGSETTVARRGEHNREVLSELGYATAEIDRLSAIAALLD